MTPTESAPSFDHIACLDGLRGLAAFWVLLGHAFILTGCHVAILAEPDLAVDLFIILSGFLMAFHYAHRESREPWQSKATWTAFWIRRYFRLAPLYYVTLVLALVLGGWLFESRTQIDAFLHAKPQQAARYLDAGLLNILTHVSFVFGLIPWFAHRTALPDWSIGLEMQFYAVFPFIMLLLRKLDVLFASLLLAVVMFLALRAMPDLDGAFALPSFLPLKLHLFLGGILISSALFDRSRTLLYCGLACLIVSMNPVGPLFDTKAISRMVLMGLFCTMILHDRLPRGLATMAWPFKRILESRPLVFAGDVSYGVYLIHLFILIPASAYAIRVWGHAIQPATRLAIVFSAVAPLVYLGGWLGYRLIEMPGRNAGRRVLSWSARRRPANRPSPPQTCDAPDQDLAASFPQT